MLAQPRATFREQGGWARKPGRLTIPDTATRHGMAQSAPAVRNVRPPKSLLPSRGSLHLHQIYRLHK